MIQGVSLIRAAAIGACALLGLKIVGLLQDAAPPAVAAPSYATQPAPAPFPAAMKRVTAGRPADPETTGSVGGGGQAPKKKEEPPPPPPLDPAAAAALAASNKAGVFEGKPPLSPAEKALYERLGERRNALDGRAAELDERQKLLESAEKRLDSRIGELKTTEDKLAEEAKKQDPAVQALKNLVVMYEAMKPKDAARVFDRLSFDVLVPVVNQMNPRKMSEILAAMSPEAAEKLTVALAQRGTLDKGQMAGGPLPANELPSLR